MHFGFVFDMIAKVSFARAHKPQENYTFTKKAQSQVWPKQKYFISLQSLTAFDVHVALILQDSAQGRSWLRNGTDWEQQDTPRWKHKYIFRAARTLTLMVIGMERKAWERCCLDLKANKNVFYVAFHCAADSTVLGHTAMLCCARQLRFCKGAQQWLWHWDHVRCEPSCGMAEAGCQWCDSYSVHEVWQVCFRGAQGNNSNGCCGQRVAGHHPGQGWQRQPAETRTILCIGCLFMKA